MGYFTERLELRLRPDQHKRLTALAAVCDVPVAALARQAVDDLLARMEEPDHE